MSRLGRFVMVVVSVATTITACTGDQTADPGVTYSEDAAGRLRPLVTRAERDDYIEACLRSEGSAAFTRKPDGGFSGSNVRPSDEEAMRTCADRSFEQWPNPPWPSSREEFEVLFVLYARQADCLAEQGFYVDLPSLDSYIEGNGFWIPYDDVPAPGSMLGWESLNRLCPQDPWRYELGVAG